jgi:hypothetical protein
MMLQRGRMESDGSRVLIVESVFEHPCLCLFGIEMPAHPTREEVQAEYEIIWQNLCMMS